MRAFVAAEVSERAREQVRAHITGLRNRGGGVRWVKPEQMHLTLAFLGEVTDEFAREARERLEQVASGIAPFEVRMAGIGAFPTPARARVVWVGVQQGAQELCRLQAAVSRELAAIGYVPETRPFSPHLTLGRLKIPADVSDVCGAKFESERFTIERVVLFRSLLKPTGPEYSRLGEWHLGQPE